MPDGSGDRLIGQLHRPAAETGRPLVVLIHGLTGCEGSFYILNSAAAHLAAGYPVLRLNLRGAGPARATCRGQYHAGRTEDLRALLQSLPDGFGDRPVLPIGYSLGGNMLLKFLAEFGAEFDMPAAAAVSPPLDLAASARRIMETRNAVYHRWLLDRMKEEAVAGAADVSEAERAAIGAAPTVYDYDDTFVGPRHGYEGADAYYAANSGKAFLSDIDVPTIIVHAEDDPWIPAAAFRNLALPEISPVRIELTPGGGHVGFHAAGHRTPWHDRAIRAYFDAVLGDR